MSFKALALSAAILPALVLAAPRAPSHAATTMPLCSGQGCNTLALIEKLQERESLIKAQTDLAKAEADRRSAQCAGGACTGTKLTPAQRRQAEARAAASQITIAGVYRKPDGRYTADLFVNTARVPVQVGTALPNGLVVSMISSSRVQIKTPAGEMVDLNFPGIDAVAGATGPGGDQNLPSLPIH